MVVPVPILTSVSSEVATTAMQTPSAQTMAVDSTALAPTAGLDQAKTANQLITAQMKPTTSAPMTAALSAPMSPRPLLVLAMLMTLCVLGRFLAKDTRVLAQMDGRALVKCATTSMSATIKHTTVTLRPLVLIMKDRGHVRATSHSGKEMAKNVPM